MFKRSEKNKVLKKTLVEINKLNDNFSIEYIIDRINSKNYQGHVNVNHNRITIQKIISILEILNKHKEIKIPKGDAGKGKYNIQDYPEFSELVKHFHKENKQGTQNSIKKNLGPDFARYGFIKRHLEDKNTKKREIFSENNQKISTHGKNIYWSITFLGTKFLKEDKIGQEGLLKESVNTTHEKIITLTYETLKVTATLSFFEFMMFVNKPRFYYLKEDIEFSVKLIENWRMLGRANRERVEKILKNTDINKQRNINKMYKFDYSNWNNDTQQLVDTFRKLYIFKIDKKFNFNNPRTISGKKKRDKNIYKEYNKNHNIVKKLGYEYHHIIPLSKAETNEQLILVDNSNNLIYLDAGIHSKFSQLGNPYLKINKINIDVFILESLYGEKIKINAKDCKYDFIRNKIIIDHNKKTLNELEYY